MVFTFIRAADSAGPVAPLELLRTKDFPQISDIGKKTSHDLLVPALRGCHRSLHMTIRKKILLFSALALGAFLAAVYLVSRFALLNSFSLMESNYARDNIHHLQNELQNEQSRLRVIARDYAQWDRTYESVQSRDPKYVSTELTDETFKIVNINQFLLLDNAEQIVVNKSVGGVPLSEDDVRAIAAAYSYAQARNGHGSAMAGILELRKHLVLLAYEPVLTSSGDGPARGTLVMGRELDGALVSSLSRSSGFPVWVEMPGVAGIDHSNGIAWNDGTRVRFEGESSMLEYVPVKDLFGSTRRLLVGRIPRELNTEGRKVMRYLLGLLMVAGAVYCGALFFFLEEILLARVASLSTKVTQVTVSGDLSLRLDPGGNDELSSLAGAVNAMLAGIQKAKVELLQAQESLRFHAEHDSLTGVLNRRAIRDVLRRELARCRRENQTLGVILADVDHFKKINDRYGHAAGDAVLVGVVQRISSTLRRYDIVGRYGGEEFLIIAPGCDLELAERLAERIRAAVEQEPVDLGNEIAPITLSLGVTLGTSTSDPDFLVTMADTAMYQAKRNGRNRLETSLMSPEQELLQLP
jgi:diguanylate cyclase (GGDEF)-like protein